MFPTRLFVVSILFALASGVQPVQAQQLSESPAQASALEATALYAGPGDTYHKADELASGQVLTIVERNNIGTWLHVRGIEEETGDAVDGWVMTGSLTLSPDLRFSRVPVNQTLPDADPDNTEDMDAYRLYAVPVISRVSPQMQLIYQRGQALGNHSGVVTKVGDSLTADPIYLTPLGRDDNVLGPYDYLADTMAFFGPQMAHESIAARVGMSTRVIFDPMWTRNALCEPNETPLACEYRLRKPSVAFIMFGPNDVLHMDASEFEAGLRAIVLESLHSGVIPVLSTFSYNPDTPHWDQALAFNLAVVRVANENAIPLVNLWLAAGSLPNYGLEGDDVHMRHSGFRYLKFNLGDESRYGVSLRNLLTLRMLDEIRRTIGMF